MGFGHNVSVNALDGFERVRGDKAVAALGHGNDEALAVLTVAQRLAQRSHVHAQVDVLDYTFGPHPGNQGLLADHLTGVRQQDQQNVQRRAAKAHGLFGVHHPTLFGVDPVGAEVNGLSRGKSQRSTPAKINNV